MLATRDSFLKFLEAGLLASGLPVKSAPDKPLTLNALNVTFMNSVPFLRASPGRYELTVSLDLLVSGDPQVTAERKVEALKRAVDEVLAAQTTPKLDYSTPATPVGLGSALYWQLWQTWRRVPDPESLYEHWNQTLSILWFEEERP